jgi:hypothetical protein
MLHIPREPCCASGLPDFSWSKHAYQIEKNIPNDHKLFQMAINYTKWPQNIPDGHKIYQHFPWQGPLKLSQIGIFGLKINHLATLLCLDMYILD